MYAKLQSKSKLSQIHITALGASITYISEEIKAMDQSHLRILKKKIPISTSPAQSCRSGDGAKVNVDDELRPGLRLGRR
jgi:hypothetical protein